jgi:hypothetical protein
MDKHLRKITTGVAAQMLRLLLEKGLRSPSGRQYTMAMVHNWLYGKVEREPNMELVYLEIVGQSTGRKENYNKAQVHLREAQRLLLEA